VGLTAMAHDSTTPSWLTRWLIAKSRHRPAGHLVGFALRYWLWRPATREGFAIRLIRLHHSDPIPYHHDLPARTLVWVLSGDMRENIETSPGASVSVSHATGSVFVRGTASRSRLEMPDGTAEAVLLVITGRREKELSYFTEFGAVSPRLFRNTILLWTCAPS